MPPKKYLPDYGTPTKKTPKTDPTPTAPSAYEKYLAYLQKVQSAKKTTPTITSVGKDPTPKPPPEKPEFHTVTTDETFASIADYYKVDQKDLIDTAGVKNLTAGAIITVPKPKVTPYVDSAQQRGDYLGEYTGGSGYQAEFDTLQKRLNSLAPGARGPQKQEITDRMAELRGLMGTGAQIPMGREYTPKVQGPEDFAAIQAAGKIPSGPKSMLDTLSNWWSRGTMDPDYKPRDISTIGDVSREKAMADRAEAMEIYYHKPLKDTLVTPDSDVASGDYANPLYDEEGYSLSQYPKTDDVKNRTSPDDSNFIHYNGRIIPREEFGEFLKHLEIPAFDEDDPYWQNKIFHEGTKKSLESMMWGLRENRRDWMVNVITPEMLDYYDPERDWADFMINIMNYRWDGASASWIKQEEDDRYPVGGAGGAGGGGGGYGGGWGGGDDLAGRSGQFVRRTGATRIGTSAQRIQVGGTSPIHWRV